MAKLSLVIISETSRGRGESHDPYREVKQFWSINGDLLGEIDSLAPQYDRCTGEWVCPKWMKTKAEKKL